MANEAILIPISDAVPHPGATFLYSEFKGFNQLPTTVRFCPDLK